MSSGPPRKPPGAPPSAPPAGGPPQAVRGMSSVARGPAGPPPRGAPMAALKPPPMAPPRGPNVTQRPPVETIKAIQPRPMGAPPSAGAPTGPPRGAGAPRQPPPRPGGPPPFAEHIPDDTDDASRINTGPMVRGMAPPKFSQAARPAAPPKKAGAIAMFRPPDPSIEPADKKMRLDEQPGAGRQPRPAPPRPQPPGIPSGQPMPPTQKPNDGSKPPAPTHPAPNRNRAPPKVVEKPKPGERPKERIVAPDPPTTEPPFKRGLKVKEEEVVFVPRRERENPEFESSSSEEEDEPVQPKSKDPFAAIKPKEETESVAPSVEEEKPKLAAVSKEPVTPEVKVKVIGDEEFQDMDETEIPGASAVSIAETFDTRETEDDGVVVAPVVAPSIGMPPQVGVTHDNTMSSYVPPAPQEFVPQNVDSTLSRDLNGGRFSIRCIEGINIRRKDDTSAQPRTDPFIKFKLGAAERFPWQNTGIKRKQDQNPNFGNEVVAFNMLNPGQYVFLDDVQLTIEVWNKSPFKDELMGAVTMSVVRILKSPYALFKETVPLFLPGLKQSNSKLVLEFVFEEARAGLFVITLFEAHGIRNIDPMGQQHPFINFHVGPSYSKKSKVVKDGKSDPYFGEEEILIWADNENWIHDINFDMCDENVGVEKPICSSSLSMLPYMNMEAGEAKQDEFDLFYYIQTDPKDDREKREVASGVLMMRVEFLQAGQLSVLCTKGKNLQFPESHHTAGDDLRMDPYCNLSLDGQAVKIVKRTPVDKDGGHDPVWNHEIKFNVVDQYLVDLDVYHQNMQGNDVLLGYTQISLLPIFRNGRSEFWVTLKQQKITGGVIEVGAVHLSFTFKATPGVAFPRHRTDVDVFDDTVRKLPPPAKDIEEDDVIEVKPEISTIPDEESSVVDREDSPTKDRFGEETQEFSDAEIIAAFKFIDLDHNNFVGASEIRHILVCMGEMITDEEIDTMISMVDVDGDGQVSFKEFRTMILHPNPAEANLTKEIGILEENESNLEKQALAGKHVGLDLTAFQRQKEMLQREARKKLLIGFVADNEVDYDFVKHAYSRYSSLPKEKRKNGRIVFDVFCQVVDVEPIAEYKQIHELFDTEEQGDMDFREFLLSLMNFVEVEREVRVRFSFAMFDEQKTGFISIKEVEEILRGNHMISVASVQRKAQTIMKQASTNQSGFITCNEFVVVSKKFPNILLPVLNAAALRSK